MEDVYEYATAPGVLELALRCCAGAVFLVLLARSVRRRQRSGQEGDSEEEIGAMLNVGAAAMVRLHEIRSEKYICLHISARNVRAFCLAAEPTFFKPSLTSLSCRCGSLVSLFPPQSPQASPPSGAPSSSPVPVWAPMPSPTPSPPTSSGLAEGGQDREEATTPSRLRFLPHFL